MKNEHGDSKPVRVRRRTQPALTTSRLVALTFVLSVALPIGWGFGAQGLRSTKPPKHLAPPPETAGELFAMAAKASTRGARTAPVPPVERQTEVASAEDAAGLELAYRQRLSAEQLLALAPHGVSEATEIPQSMIANELDQVTESKATLAPDAAVEPQSSPAIPETPTPKVVAQAAPPLATVPEFTVPAAPVADPGPAVAETDSIRYGSSQAATTPTRQQVASNEPAPLTGRTAPVSVVELLERSAAAPQLSSISAAQTSAARRAAAGFSAIAPRDTARLIEPVRPTGAGAGKTGPVPATRKEIEAVRAAQTRALSAGASAQPQTTRRRIAMHRVAAATASALNEATPFRTGGSGYSRFESATTQSLGEGLDRAAEAVSVVPGLRLENVSLSAGYSTNGLPGARSLYAGSNLGSDTDFGATATMAYRKRFRSSSFGLTYTPTRTQRMNFTEWSSTDHILGLEMDRKLGRRWGVGFSGGASNTGLEQFWFRQPVLRRVENPPTTLEELLARSEAGEFTDDEFASLITGAPVVDDPGGREIALTRVTGVSGTLNASYAHSARHTFSFGLNGSSYEASNAFGNRDASQELAVNRIARTGAFFSSSYRWNPGLTAGTRYNLNGNDSNLGQSLSHTASVYVNKRLSRFWATEVSAGAGVVDFNPNPGLLHYETVQSRPTWTAQGSLSYRYGGHAFQAFGRRQVGDSLGLSAATTLSTGLAWEWRTPRMPWSFNGTASYSTSDWGFATINGSSTAFETSLLQAGVTRILSPTTAFSTGYYFGRYASPLRGLLTGTTIHRVQASFLWRPVEPR